MIDSLEKLTEKKTALKVEIRTSEKKLSRLWNETFHQQESSSSKSYSPTQKVLSFLSSSSVVIDGALLGWKLYNRFYRSRRRR